MPGLIIFGRRWSVGSDDLVVPAAILFIIHFIWLIVLAIVLIVVDYRVAECMSDLHEHTLGFVIILIGCVVTEAFISCISMKGSILNGQPRTHMRYLLYVRLGILLIEILWLIVGSIRISKHYQTCPSGLATDALVGVTICNWCVVASVLITIWCTFDAAGRSWVKMTVYQNSLRDAHSKYRYKRSGNGQRNWRHRKAVREYQNSWDRRCRLLFCCVGRSDRQQNSFTEIAKLLSEFFRDLDIVPSDVVAGLILLRKYQKTQRNIIVNKRTHDTFQFLSGVAVTSNTKFLDVNHPIVAEEIKTLVHFLHYALAVYGWPVFMMMNSATGCCQLFPNLRCCPQNPLCLLNCCGNHANTSDDNISASDDNCCRCNYAALKNICRTHNYKMIYATYHVAIGEPPFFVALDFDKKSIIISVRGTLSLHDVITDLNAEGELLPTNPLHDDWLGHKGMVEAAVYIRNKLKSDNILKRAFDYCPEIGTQNYSIILVGHSLGAGTAAILAILLKEEYPDLICFAFAPPGGLLSASALEYTKDFIISIVLGKDVVPRLGLHQMETLRYDLINAIKLNNDPKWKIIGKGIICCPSSANNDDNIEDFSDINDKNKQLSAHPNDDTISLTVHSPLYPPGRIIHLVRNHPKKSDNKYESKWRQVVGKSEPVFQALWADNTNFSHILISPVMIQDHMPDKILHALEKLLVHTGPAKPQRIAINGNQHHFELSNRPLLSTSFSVTPNSLGINRSLHSSTLGNETSFSDAPLIANNVENFKRLKQKCYRPTNFVDVNNITRVDLHNDEWFGAAPLASPETLSDISSLSSRSTTAGSRNSWGRLPVFTICEKSINDHQYPYSYLKNDSNSYQCAKISNEQLLQPQTLSQCKNELNIPLNEIDIHTNVNPILDTEIKFIGNNDKNINLLNLSGDNNDASNGNNDIVDQLIHQRGSASLEILENKDHYNNNSSPHSSDNNADDNAMYDLTNQNHAIQTLQRFSSDTDLNNHYFEQPHPLRRSHEEIHLNNLDDNVCVFETEPSINLNSSRNSSKKQDTANDGQVSPTLKILINKLLTIESPTSESINQF